MYKALLAVIVALELGISSFVIIPLAGELSLSIPAIDETDVSLPALDTYSVEMAFPELSFEMATSLTNAHDDTDRLFVLLQRGLIMVFPNVETTSSTSVFLDLTEKVNDSGPEQGLLGLAFDPLFKSNGYFYTYYTGFDDLSFVSRFSVSNNDPNRANPNSELVILQVDQPYESHNGGNLEFGPDDFLYIGLGDGGESFNQLFERGWVEAGGEAQDRDTILGSILRIDVSASSIQEPYRIPPDNPFVGIENVRGEIFALGFKNPWRFSFDRETGLLWGAEVGQEDFEEIDIIEKGANYGWNILEGNHCYPREITSCSLESAPPLFEYSHEEGCAIIGGFVYRGSELDSLVGAYIYGDRCSGKIWALYYDGNEITEHVQLIDTDLIISSFGVDERGELYIVSYTEGIYRLRSSNGLIVGP